MKKKGTHSTQPKYFGTIPRSEFYGIAIGYALGLFICAALNLETQIPQLALAAAGFGIGYFIDKQYFQEPDEPEGSPAETGVMEKDGPEVGISEDDTPEDN